MMQDETKSRGANAPTHNDSHASAEASARIVRCPNCRGDSIYGPSNPYRPFCGARCKGLDFGAWADESFRMAAETEPDEMAPENSRLQ
jgi:hypothetical protein